MDSFKNNDSEIFDLIDREKQRQIKNIELIASENFVSQDVLNAMGTVLTNKYAEGYPSKRYYGGCSEIDKIEQLAIDRLKELYNAEHANVQPHSGSQANMAVYQSVLKPNDTILSMDLSHGGHLTHGSPISFSGKLYNFKFYGVNRETQTIDYDQVLQIAKKENPKLILCGYSAYPRKIDFKAFREICNEVNSYMMVDMAHIAGLIAGGVHDNPTEYADFVTTTTHKTLRGPRGGAILCKKIYSQQVDKSVFPGVQGGPLLNIIAAKAVSFKEALNDNFKEYAKNIVQNASSLANYLKKYDFKLVSDGTDNHLILIDLKNKNISGKEFEKLLDTVGITVNKNCIPFETEKPTITSGIRIGTSAVTTRGFKDNEMEKIAYFINSTLENKDNPEYLTNISNEIYNLTSSFPLFNSDAN